MTKLLRNDNNFIGSINDLGFSYDDHHHTMMMASNAKFQQVVPSYRTDLQEIFEGRLHSVMHYRSHTVNDSLY